jgi:hypothetical protein
VATCSGAARRGGEERREIAWRALKRGSSRRRKELVELIVVVV